SPLELPARNPSATLLRHFLPRAARASALTHQTTFAERHSARPTDSFNLPSPRRRRRLTCDATPPTTDRPCCTVPNHNSLLTAEKVRLTMCWVLRTVTDSSPFLRLLA